MAFPSYEAALLTRRHLASGSFVSRIVRVVAWGIVVSGVPVALARDAVNAVGSDPLLQLLDLQIERCHASSPPFVDPDSRHVQGCGVYLPAGPSGIAPLGTALWLLLLLGLEGLLCSAPTVSGAIRCSSSSTFRFRIPI